MTCNLSINFGIGFFWGLTFVVAGLVGFLSWQGSRIYHVWCNEKALAKSIRSLEEAKWVAFDQRTPRPKRPNPKATLMRLKHPLPTPPLYADASVGREGWKRMDDYYYPVAAE